MARRRRVYRSRRMRRAPLLGWLSWIDDESAGNGDVALVSSNPFSIQRVKADAMDAPLVPSRDVTIRRIRGSVSGLITPNTAALAPLGITWGLWKFREGIDPKTTVTAIGNLAQAMAQGFMPLGFRSQWNASNQIGIFISDWAGQVQYDPGSGSETEEGLAQALPVLAQGPPRGALREDPRRRGGEHRLRSLLRDLPPGRRNRPDRGARPEVRTDL